LGQGSVRGERSRRGKKRKKRGGAKGQSLITQRVESPKGKKGEMKNGGRNGRKKEGKNGRESSTPDS